MIVSKMEVSKMEVSKMEASKMKLINSNGAARLVMNDEERVELLEKGQTCLGEPTDVERVLDSKCPCLRSKCFHLSWTFLLYAVGAIVLVYFCRVHLKNFLEWLQHVDKWISALVFLVMFTLVSFPMTWGYIVLNLAAGYLYGFAIGLCTVSVSVFFGVIMSLVICRRFIRGYVQSKLQSAHLKAIIQVIESRRGFRVVILTRLTPIPFGLQNGLFAVIYTNIYCIYFNDSVYFCVKTKTSHFLSNREHRRNRLLAILCIDVSLPNLFSL